MVSVSILVLDLNESTANRCFHAVVEIIGNNSHL